MFLWCKETKRIYYFVLCPAFLITFSIGVFGDNAALILVSAILYIFFFVLLSAMVYKKMLDLNRSFKNELDIKNLLDFYENAAKGRLYKNSMLLVKTNLITGYLACGEIGKAFDVYNKNPYSHTMSKKPETLITYLLVATECLLTGGYIDNIENNFTELNALLGKVNPKNSNNFKISVDLLRFQYLCQSGNYDGLEEMYEDLSGRVDSAYRKIKLNYWCGVYYNKTDRREEAQDKFRFVAENGKETIFAKRARELVSCKRQSGDGSMIELEILEN